MVLSPWFVLCSSALAFACSAAQTNTPAGTAGSGSGAAGESATAGAGGSASDTGGAAGAGAASAGSAGRPMTPSSGGFGRNTQGGSGGRVIKVTTLAPTGPGSFAEALAATGPRIVVFEVGGVIDLNLARLSLTEPFITIAGQTAPPPGITFIRGGLVIRAHDVVMQHVRFRMGDASTVAASGFEPDVTTDGAGAYDILIDHCSVAWGVDENLSVSGPRLDGPEATSRRITLSHNIIAEGLRNSVHEKGAHSMGTLVHDHCTDIAVVGNLYAHNDERNPWFKGFATGVIVNNVVYNPGRWAMRLGPVDSEWAAAGVSPGPPRVSIVGNVMRHGANTPATLAMVGSNSRGEAYLEDNLAFTVSGADAPIVASSVTVLAERPAWPDWLEARPAASVVDWVLSSAGARPKERDSVDQRIVAGVLAGTGTLVNSQDDVGGYPAPAATTRALEVPADDVDAWLARFAADLE